jgi:hypothetical protein
MGDQSGANATFATPQDDGMSTSEQVFFDATVLSAALERWVRSYGEQEGCTSVPAQHSEASCAG